MPWRGIVLTNILQAFPMTSGPDRRSRAVIGVRDLDGALRSVAGATLANDFYRFHTTESARTANDLSARLIDGFDGRYRCFAFDWLGRHLAVKVGEQTPDGLVIAVDPGSGEYLKTDVRFSA
jgi:hypothetical protein